MVEFDKELWKLQNEFEQTLIAAANVNTFGEVSQICINIMEIISTGNVTFLTFSVN